MSPKGVQGGDHCSCDNGIDKNNCDEYISSLYMICKRQQRHGREVICMEKCTHVRPC